jgi:hypothetical protein
MRPLLLALLAALTWPLFANAGPQGHGKQVVRLSEPVIATDTFETFGAPLPASPAPVSLRAALAAHRGSNEPVVIETEVVKVCQKKGCFFIARDGEAVARVSFVDYSFFVPTDSAGKKVLLAGVLHQQELTEEQAEHLSGDLGEKGAVDAGLEFTIVASSVQIPL